MLCANPTDALASPAPQYGEVVDVNIVRDRDTGKSKGFAFLAYEDQRSTVLAVDNLSGSRVAGRTLRVEHVDDYKLRRKEVEKEGGVVGGTVNDAALMPPPPPPPRVNVPDGAMLEQAGERGEEPYAWGHGPPHAAGGRGGGGGVTDADADADARALAAIKARRAAVMAAAAAVAAGGTGLLPAPGLPPGLQGALRPDEADRMAAKRAKKEAKRARKESRHAKREARSRARSSSSSSSDSRRRSRSRSRERRRDRDERR